MKGKRYKTKERKKEKKILKNILVKTILLIFISIMVFTGIRIFNWLIENKKSQDILDEISDSISIDENIDSSDKYNINFENLKQINSETVAWLKVNGTNIEYPVVKTTNNDYYMTHSFDKSHNSAGWAFMDYRNKFDGTDKNIVIYAHNRMDGSLFGTLKNILKEDWQNKQENLIIPFITENEKAEYQVFSVYRIEMEDYYITTDFKTVNQFEEFIDTINSRSMKDFGIKVSTDDHILTLSTCADNNKYRVVLHAKKIK